VRLRDEASHLVYAPLLSVLLPVFNLEREWLERGLSDFHGGVILVSGDGGATWDLVGHASQTYNAGFGVSECLDHLHGIPQGESYTAWGGVNAASPDFDTVLVDLLDFVGSSEVKVRFVFGTDSIGSNFQGWFVKNVRLGPHLVLE
jgi:hypothetical protein